MALDLGILNPRQREAVTAPLTPLFVLAGPGTGKTTVLTHRIAYLVATGQAAPQHLLAVTFTNRAARELRQRLQALCPATGGATIGTLHAFGLAVLRRFADRIGYDPGSLSVIDRADQRVVVQQVLGELGLDERAVSLETALRWLSWWKREGGWREDPDETVDAVVRGVAQLCRRHNLVDFDDMLLLPLGLLREFAEVRTWAQDHFSVVLVDEVQDLDDTQYRLLALLAERDRQFTVVGDPVQNVYAWRGATLRPLGDLRRDFPELRIIELDQSYRATETILDVAASLGDVVTDGRRHLATTRGTGEPVRVVVSPDEAAEAAFVARALRHLRRAGRIARWQDCAILYRARWQGDVLEPALGAADIPYRRIDANDLLATREVGDVLAYLRIVANPADRLALARVIDRPPRRLAALEKALRDDPRCTLADLATARPSALADSRARASLQRLLDLHRELTGLAARVTPAELLATTIQRSGYAAWLATREDGATGQRHLDALRTIANASTAEDLVSFLAEVESLVFEGHLPGGDGVVLSTIHRAKGLEFATVFVVGWAEGLLPHAWARDEPRGLEEEIRLAYAALTRAMDRLTLTVPLATIRDGHRSPREPSRFLDALPRQRLRVTTTDGKER